MAVQEVDWAAVAKFFEEVIDIPHQLQVTVESPLLRKKLSVIVPNSHSGNFMKSLPTFGAEVSHTLPKVQMHRPASNRVYIVMDRFSGGDAQVKFATPNVDVAFQEKPNPERTEEIRAYQDGKLMSIWRGNEDGRWESQSDLIEFEEQ